MEMEEDMTVRLQVLVNDEKLTKAEKVKALQGLYHHAKAEQPGAEDSPMMDDEALSDALQHIKAALESLGASVGTSLEPVKAP